MTGPADRPIADVTKSEVETAGTSANIRPKARRNSEDGGGFADVVGRVRELHAAIMKQASDSREKALTIGEELAAIKRSLAHGRWLPWLAENLPEITARSAQNYLRVWKNRVFLKNETDSFFAETLTAALAAISKWKKEATDKESTRPARNGNGNVSLKRELLRDLSREFVAGLECEQFAVLEMISRNLSHWRQRLLDTARNEMTGASMTQPNVEPPELVANES